MSNASFLNPVTHIAVDGEKRGWKDLEKSDPVIVNKETNLVGVVEVLGGDAFSDLFEKQYGKTVGTTPNLKKGDVVVQIVGAYYMDTEDKYVAGDTVYLQEDGDKFKLAPSGDVYFGTVLADTDNRGKTFILLGK